MFKMNLFVTLLCVSVLRISLGINFKSTTEVWKDEKTVFLISADRGMRFYSKSNNVFYDCSVGNSFEGTIDLDDKQHPKATEYLFIENCDNITLNLYSCDSNIKSVHVTGVEELTIHSNENKLRETVITDVKMLNWTQSSGLKNSRALRWDWSKEDFYSSSSCGKRHETSLILKNVVLKYFDDNSIDKIQMTGVIAEKFTLGLLSASILSIKDSRFDHLEPKSIYGEVQQVYIVNNTFGRMLPLSFDLFMKESFVFSDNHVSKIFDAFNITGPKVEIVGNTFDYAEKTAFTIGLIGPTLSEDVFKSLNVSFNIMNTSTDNLVRLREASKPDFLAIERNQFNCRCATSLYLERLVSLNSTNIITKFLLDDNLNNVCVNFGNCPLRKLLGKETSVCMDTFVCPDDFSQVSAITLEKIWSEIKNVTEILNSFKKQDQKNNYSNITSTEN